MGQEASVPTSTASLSTVDGNEQQQLDVDGNDGRSSALEPDRHATGGLIMEEKGSGFRQNDGLEAAEDELLEAQARAPPSVSQPPSGITQQPPLSKRKQLLARLTHRPIMHHHHHAQQQQQSHVSDEPGEPSNGSAGNFFITRDGMTPDAVARDNEELASASLAAQQQPRAGGGGALRRLGGGKAGAAASAGGAAATTTASTWIQSMRNLTLGSSANQQQPAASYKSDSNIRQQQQVQDWEKQWDEDEDEEEEDDDERQPPKDERGRGPVAPPIRPGMDVGHTPSSYPPPPPAFQSGSQVQQQSSFPVSTGLQQQQYAIPPPQYASSNYQQQQAQHYVTEESVAWEQQRKQQKDAALPTPSAPLSPRAAAVTPPPPHIVPVAPPTAPKPQLEMFLPMLRVLGKGSFGKVVLVQKQVGKDRGQLFAMKILQKSHLVKRRQLERTRTERKVLSVVNHPFIMKLHYAFQSTDKLYLVLDYCPGGELFFHLSRFRRFPERVARFYAAELLLAMGHLHKRGIIYRDLKPENVLLDADGHVKLGDFGLAKAGIQHPCEGAHSMCGTPEYMAPEVLLQSGHGFCVDYWGLGMLVYEMMTGLPPWYTTDRAKLFRRLKSAPLDIPSYFTVQAANCVSALLERDPKRRLGVTGIRTAMEHDFFRTISWRALYARRIEAPVRPCEGWKPPEAVPEGDYDDRMDVEPLRSNTDWNEIEKLDSNELDAATANFDNAFTRLPVESEGDSQNGQHQEAVPAEEGGEELTADSFVGFTFDGKESSGGGESAAPTTSSPSRTRTQRYN